MRKHICAPLWCTCINKLRLVTWGLLFQTIISRQVDRSTDSLNCPVLSVRFSHSLFTRQCFSNKWTFWENFSAFMLKYKKGAQTTQNSFYVSAQVVLMGFFFFQFGPFYSFCFPGFSVSRWSFLKVKKEKGQEGILFFFLTGGGGVPNVVKQCHPNTVTGERTSDKGWKINLYGTDIKSPEEQICRHSSWVPTFLNSVSPKLTITRPASRWCSVLCEVALQLQFSQRCAHVLPLIVW